jgi:hypothetical protein
MKKEIIILVIVLCLSAILLNSSIYLTTKPAFCALCHRAEPKALEKTAHAGLNCSDCHQKKGLLAFGIQRTELLRMAVSQLTGSYRKPISAEVSNENCYYCHDNVNSRLQEVNAVRVSHKEIMLDGAKCTDCHNTIAHKKAVANAKFGRMEDCLQCHNSEGASPDCETCHVSGADRKRRIVKGPWQLTHGPNWRNLHGMGNIKTCSACHEKNTCARCHQIDLPHPLGFMGIHGNESKKFPESCLVCHKQSFCSDCHKIRMPHPADFLPKHKKEYKSQGKKICLSCHTVQSCDLCHEMHAHPGLLPNDIKRLRE